MPKAKREEKKAFNTWPGTFLSGTQMEERRWEEGSDEALRIITAKRRAIGSGSSVSVIW